MDPQFIGTMLSAAPGPWANDAIERVQAHAIFGTPLDTRTWFTEPHGFWWGVYELLFPHANAMHVWLYAETWR